MPAPEVDAVVVVRFQGNRRDYYHNRAGLPLRAGQDCIVEADRGQDLGRITYCGPGPGSWRERADEQGVVALATAHDLARLPGLRRQEDEARDVALQKIAHHGLPMDLVGVERRWDHGKLTFYFLADGRVDFRALVRDLASIFRTRIDLRQIGVRDEARMKGGLGICGREFCCTGHMTGFVSVALRMAKDQQLPLNPAKLSGPCGRLRCCLAHEHGQYRESLRAMPRLNGDVIWQGRPGRARKLDPLRGTVLVEFRDDGRELVELAAEALDYSRTATDGTEDGGRERGRQPRARDGKPRDGGRGPRWRRARRGGRRREDDGGDR
jgi:cell fate regulator YaaT (PSP1 superfamily)